MRDGGRIAAAIEVLTDVETHHRPASVALRDWGVRHRFAGSGDRAAIGNLVFDALRGRLSLGAAGGDGSARAAVLAAYVHAQGHGLEALKALFEGDKFAPEPLSEAEEAALARTLDDALKDAPLATRCDAPDLAITLMEPAFGAALEAELRAMTARAPLDLRVNTLKASPEKAAKALQALIPLPTALSPTGLRIQLGDKGRMPNLSGELAFAKGFVEVQDEGSQIASLMIAAEPGMQVLDYCAGAGGKTLALAAIMNNRGQLFAHDSDKSRMADLWPRLQRAGVRNTQLLMPRDPGLEVLVGKMDRVVIDAPCTGTGTWRRGPDAKWKLNDRVLAERCADQAEILRETACYTAPGGRLIYITCSLLREENEYQIKAFLESDAGAGFALLEAASVWNETITAPLPDDALCPIEGHGMALRLTPARHDTDGFFVAVMERTGEGEAREDMA